ncbi:ATPase [Novosphingobium decolorationis]|uniref:ATPase n=1 Tax=Novosphingobium decolorationis TaxID=2698673 RepID=A0ABX8E142_9SPHN|nr:ATPase [Novosphingobium decolorationis]QVM82788.1 ATPase [Novosphingobium decolorationis]
MSGDSRIISFGGASTEDSATQAKADDPTRLRDALAPSSEAEDAAPASDWDDAWIGDDTATLESSDARSSRSWIAPALSGLGLLAWSGLFLAAHWTYFQADFTLAAVPALISQWCVPPLLIGIVWLLALRHSTREGKRFGDIASTLSLESERLERRLLSVNRELSLAREFVAAQSRDLEALGRLASERLSGNARKLQELIEENGERLETIGTVSTTALDNMEKLRGQLPVIASSAKDVTSNIGNAGRTARSQIEDMIAGFHRLNEFGQANERQIASVRTAVDAALAQFAGQCEDLEVLARQRFEALAEKGQEFRSELERHETDALAAIRTRSAALQSELHQTREQLDESEAATLTSLRARLSALREECGVVGRSLTDAQGQATRSVQDSFETLKAEHETAHDLLVAAHETTLDQLSQRIEALGTDAARTEDRISSAQQTVLATFSDRLSEVCAQADAAFARLKDRDGQFASEASERHQRQLEQERHALAHIEHMLVELDNAVAERLEGHRHQAEALSERARSVTSQLEQFDARLRSIATQSADAEGRLSASLHGLAENLAASRASLSAADGDVAKLTDDSLRLLDLLRASSGQAQHELPQALSHSEEQLGRINSAIDEVRGKLADSSTSGQALSETILQSGTSLDRLHQHLVEAQAAISEGTNDHAQRLEQLQRSLTEIEGTLLQNADHARGELTQAIADLRQNLDEAISDIEASAPARIDSVTQMLGDESGKAIDKAMRTTAAEISGQLEQAVAHATGVSREATVQLREQMEKVTELVGNLEARLDEARERASEQVNNDFARRAALITESLNSNAIDIAAAMSSEVSDTAWASYLRGDRGIFTRRAVTLIDSSEAKAIQQTFESDDAFREHVSRYIHDFESLLRQVLSTRDGNAMGVTLLSSDMGKLYVALAQAIERLRN